MTNREEEWRWKTNREGQPAEGKKHYSDSPPELTAPHRDYVSHFIRTHPDIKPVVALGYNKQTDNHTRRDYHNNGFYLKLPLQP